MEVHGSTAVHLLIPKILNLEIIYIQRKKNINLILDYMLSSNIVHVIVVSLSFRIEESLTRLDCVAGYGAKGAVDIN